QDLRHILFEHRLYTLLAFAAEDGVEFLRQFPAERVAFKRVGGQQRGYNSAGVDLGGGLGEILEEIEQATAPGWIKSHLLTHIHEDFVDEHKRCKSLPRWHRQQFNQQVLSRGAFTLGI